MIFQNLLIQCSALILGIIAGSIVSRLAQEEIGLYKLFIENSARVSFMLTLLLPLLFTQEIIFIGFIVGTYCIIGIWQQKEIQVFFWLAPLVAILSSTSSTGFFTVLTGIFIATIFSTTILLTEYTKNQQIQWNKKMWIDGAKVYVPFILFSIISYILVLQDYFHI
ncbi:MAG: hypothetical protein WC254_01375 [Candidatus Woesearchaeota archaeon]